MKLTIVVPALNEEHSLPTVLDRMPDSIPGVDDVEIVVIDDGSTDGTRAVALAKGAHVVSHSRNLGLGPTFATGIDVALRRGADVIVNLDGDGQHPPESIPRVIAPIIEGTADFVTATRFADPATMPDMPRIKLVGNRMIARITSWACGSTFTDVACGFRAYSRDTALKINIFGVHTYTQETLVDLARKGLNIVEVPVAVRGVREHGKSRVAHSVLRYGIRTSAILARAVRDRLPLAFFGAIAIVLSVLGAGAELTVMVNLLLTGKTSPYQSFTILGAILLTLGAFSLLTALLADMLGRMRETQENTLYYAKRTYYDELQTEKALPPGASRTIEEQPVASSIR